MSPVVSNWVRYPLIALLCLAAVVVLWVKPSRGPWQLTTLVGSAFRRTTSRVMPIGMVRSVLGWLFLAVVIAAATGGGLLWVLGWPRFPPTSAFSVTEMLDLLKIALAVVAGFGGVVLLAVNFRKQRVIEAEHDLAVERGDRDEVQSFNERFGAAAEQLAHVNAAVRLAGVYAMAGLADDWEDKRQVCVDVLCGYFRMSPENTEDRGEFEVREAILRLVRERVGTRYGNGLWRDVDFDFTSAEFEDADFTGLRFDGRVVFDGARFTGELTSVARTAFGGVLSCHGTTFAAKRTTFAGMSSSMRAEFVGAEFSSEQVDFSGLHAGGVAVDFYRSNFTGSRVDFSDGSVRHGTLRFDQCEFADCELDLSFVNWWVPDGVFGTDFFMSDDGTGRLMIDRCRFTTVVIDLRGILEAPSFVWLVGTRFEAVEFKVTEYADPDHRPWLNVRDEELVDTVLPAKYVRRPTVDPV